MSRAQDFGDQIINDDTIITDNVVSGEISPDAMDEEVPMDITDGQEIALSVLQITSAVLSLIGSGTIVFKIARSILKKQKTTPYDRIMFGLSSCDIMYSLMLALSPFLMPQDTILATSPRPWAFGTSQTCEVMGFFTQLSLWAIWYNCILSFYYLLTVRFKVKRRDFSRKYEPYMHLSGLIFFPTTAIVAYVLNWYGEQALTINCWIRTVPMNCDENGICLGDGDVLVGLIYGALPIGITYLALIINNIVIYNFVRKSFNLGFGLQSEHLTSVEIDENENDVETSSQHSSITSSSKTIPTGNRLSEERKIIHEKLVRETAIQGFLYVASFVLTQTPLVILVLLDGAFPYDVEDRPQLYWLLVLNSMLCPLQGFFNVFIYVRPTYTRFRAANPESPIWLVAKQALFDQNVPRIASVVNERTSLPKNPSVDIKHSKLRSKGGSNFSCSLDRILEESLGSSSSSSSSSSTEPPTAPDTSLRDQTPLDFYLVSDVDEYASLRWDYTGSNDKKPRCPTRSPEISSERKKPSETNSETGPSETRPSELQQQLKHDRHNSLSSISALSQSQQLQHDKHNSLSSISALSQSQRLQHNRYNSLSSISASGHDFNDLSISSMGYLGTTSDTEPSETTSETRPSGRTSDTEPSERTSETIPSETTPATTEQ